MSSLDTQLMHSFGARNPQLPRVIECQVPVLSSVVKVRPCPPRGTLSLCPLRGTLLLLSPPGDIVAWPSRASSARRRYLRISLRARASLYANTQVIKGQRWMPWRQEPMKDVGGCEKLRGGAYQPSIRRYPNGETPHPSWGVTPA